MLLLMLVVSACLSMPAARAAGVIARPPQTPVRSVSNAYWGVTVRDPYRWLENPSSAHVSRWIDAQNTYAGAVLGAYPNRTRLLARLRKLALTGPQQARPNLIAGNLFFLRQVPPQAQPVLVVQPWPFGAQRILVDTNPRGGLTSIEGFWPSMDGRYVAYATQEAGAESTTMHIVDVRRGALMSETLVRIGGGTSPDTVAWDADMRGFTYTRVPAPGSVPAGDEFFHSLLYHHALGIPQRFDRLVLGKGFSPVAEWGAVNSEDGKLAAAFVHSGDGSYNDVFMRDDAGTWRHVLGAAAGAMTGESETAVTTGAFVAQSFYVILTAGTPKGRVVALQGATSRTIVPQGEWAMRSLASVKGGFLVTEVSGADWRIAHYAADGRFIRIVPLPQHGIGIGDVVADAGSSDALITYDGWTIPERWVRYNAVTGVVSAPIFALRPSADYSQVRFKILYAISKDGSRVPVTVIYKDGTTNNGKAPALLTAYGGYGLTTAPGFIGSQLAWLERGGVFAVANIRGGGEYGEAWHLNGALTKKQNDYDDFAACARLMLASGWAAPARLGIVGGSNGGLLMGAALTQHPELYRAVVSFAGIYDMLRVELTPNGRFNVSEFGTVQDQAQFRAMYDYSPYHNVRPGVRYPAVLMIAGENDPRVSPWQSRKMIARLQAASTSGYPVILLTRRSAGHGIGASFSQRLGDRGAEYIFFAEQLGLR
ncbi:MAG: prolyl oligopeptidase family serine peptidase [Candidatus Eremiobacteraeota bacterium]|nr:prolyl oligopeptidase family serine peptidase [Candidatus Eremiobacteraeota bacterium]